MSDLLVHECFRSSNHSPLLQAEIPSRGLLSTGNVKRYGTRCLSRSKNHLKGSELKYVNPIEHGVHGGFETCDMPYLLKIY